MVATLTGGDSLHKGLREARMVERPLYLSALYGQLSGSDLEGPLAGKPLDALIAAIKQGKVYVNVHTSAHPDGEIRGQLYSEQ